MNTARVSSIVGVLSLVFFSQVAVAQPANLISSALECRTISTPENGTAFSVNNLPLHKALAQQPDAIKNTEGGQGEDGQSIAIVLSKPAAVFGIEAINASKFVDINGIYQSVLLNVQNINQFQALVEKELSIKFTNEQIGLVYFNPATGIEYSINANTDVTGGYYFSCGYNSAKVFELAEEKRLAILKKEKADKEAQEQLAKEQAEKAAQSKRFWTIAIYAGLLVALLLAAGFCFYYFRLRIASFLNGVSCAAQAVPARIRSQLNAFKSAVKRTSQSPSTATNGDSANTVSPAYASFASSGITSMSTGLKQLFTRVEGRNDVVRLIFLLLITGTLVFALGKGANALFGSRYGDSIPCIVNTVDDFYRNKEFNNRLENVETYVDRSNGIVTITFDFRRGGGLGTNPIVVGKFLVRFFDTNGNYLTHLVTSETYVQPEAPLNKQAMAIYKYQELKPTGNVLHYEVNVRDLQFAQATEFGFTSATGR